MGGGGGGGGFDSKRVQAYRDKVKKDRLSRDSSKKIGSRDMYILKAF
jgi:hypothetical protein